MRVLVSPLRNLITVPGQRRADCDGAFVIDRVLAHVKDLHLASMRSPEECLPAVRTNQHAAVVIGVAGDVELFNTAAGAVLQQQCCTCRCCSQSLKTFSF